MEITLEKIELVKDRTGVSYKEAKEALEAADGSVVDAIIAIEETVNISTGSKAGEFANETVEKVKELVKKGNITKISVKKDDETIVNIPVNIGLIGTIVAPWGILAAAIAAFGFKCKIELTKDDGTVVDVSRKAENLANDVKEKGSVVVDEVVAKGTAVYDGVMEKAPEMVNDIREKGTDAYNSVVNKATEVWSGIKEKKNAAEEEVEEAFDAAEEKIDDFFDGDDEGEGGHPTKRLLLLQNDRNLRFRKHAAAQASAHLGKTPDRDGAFVAWRRKRRKKKAGFGHFVAAEGLSECRALAKYVRARRSRRRPCCPRREARSLWPRTGCRP